MAFHEVLFPRLAAAIREKPVRPLGNVGGSVNYRLMATGTACIADPKPAHQEAFVDLLDEQEQEGHLTLRGPRGVACEQGAPGMHWVFNCASIVGVLKWAILRGQDRVRKACVRWIANEAGLDRHFRFQGRVYLPCPRVKDEKGQAPTEGYRDVFLALVLGENVRKEDAYWLHPQALAVSTLREILHMKPSRGVKPLTVAELRQIRQAPVPKLYLPILKTDLPRGGYLAVIEDTPEARKAMGKDTCNWVRCSPEGISWGVDWKNPPILEVA